MLKFCLLMLFTLVAARVSGEEITFDLNDVTPGKTPAGLRSLVTGQGSAADWKVANEQVPPTLAPLSPEANANVALRPVLRVQSLNLAPNHFPILLYTNELFTDFTFTTRFKIMGGIVAPEAGVVFRAQDQSNYYVLRASLDGNLLWYRVVNGIPYESLGIGVKIPIPRETWEELRVECSGSATRCFLNGNLVIPPYKPGTLTNGLAINDTTFANGNVGLWTRSDTLCYFVDTRIQYTPKVPFVQVIVEEMMRRFPSLQLLQIYANKDAALPVVVGDPDHKQLGIAGTKVEADVIEKGAIYYLKTRKYVEVTLPLRDRNGDVAAALKVRMKAFPGETEATAVGKATVVKQVIEKRIGTMQGLQE
ncbi:MAG TPA: hypothetical protein VGO67_22965 [Verrucomicrobiae bacterium]